MTRRVKVVVLAVLAALVVGACEFPRDVEGTLDRVRGGTLHVGISADEPWTRFENNDASGVEVELLRRFARTLDARIVFVEGSESELMAALEGRKLDVVIAGLTRSSEWQRVAALTRPYLTTRTVIAAPDQRTADRLSEDLGGERIAVEANSAEASKLSQDTDAITREVPDVRKASGPVALDDFLLDDLGLVATDAELDEQEHCMAVSSGENAFMVELERFLLDREDDAGDILQREARR